MTIAWSEAFSEGRLRSVSPLRLPVPVSPEWAWGDATGKGVKVAIVDSGIDADHPVIKRVSGAVAINLGPDGYVDVVDGPHQDLYGHGTACAGIVRSIAPDVELYSVRVLSDQLSGKGTVFAAGIRWCLDNGMDVVNLSLSSRSEQLKLLFHELVDEATFKNMMLVCAASNETQASYPSTFAQVFSVAAVRSDDRDFFLANPSPPVEWGAPGIDLEVAWSRGQTITSSGSSFAAPHMTGHLARISEQHPGITVSEAKAVLRALARNARVRS